MNHIASNSTKPAGSIFARTPRKKKCDQRTIRIDQLKTRSFDSLRLLYTGGWILAGPKDVVAVSSSVAVLLLAISGHRLATDEILMEALWPHPDDMPDYWADQIRVRVCKLRRLIKRVGGTEQIVVEHGRGYWLRRHAK
ncbi:MULTISPECIES: helix-turn-helix domain-containing protein [unclassified Thalassospira]|jgi:DNA-binding SARP family transcriptional activator|uniref:helix-turn-helix domain-containing protein n=1 Tax=unclassified Thalassospira TaxID=2648997 RepID=UPI001B260B83|nr:helix-turn-helix domain-containing protein [Thalassospira sp.]MBO6771737.1 helix-turn-helix domain-containing protein [Thalassospira sp.]